MRFKVLVAISLAVLVSSSLMGQYSRTRRSATPGVPVPMGARRDVIVTFHGALKKMDKKEILIQSPDNQLLTFRRSRNTKFLKSDAGIKASDIDLDSNITIDASEDVDLRLMAINVKVDPIVKAVPPPRQK